MRLFRKMALNLTTELGIRSVPTLGLFAGGREMACQVGAISMHSITWASQAATGAA